MSAGRAGLPGKRSCPRAGAQVGPEARWSWSPARAVFRAGILEKLIFITSSEDQTTESQSTQRLFRNERIEIS
jgi:hypothetical protein